MREQTPDPIDALLKRQPVQASEDFAARTLARMQRQDDGVDTFVERHLRAQPAKPSADFTRRTVERARHRSLVEVFSVPFAAAAAAVLTLGSLWIRVAPAGAQPGFAQDDTPAALEHTGSPDPSMQELMALADALRDAAPLLDPDASEALATLTHWSR